MSTHLVMIDAYIYMSHKLFKVRVMSHERYVTIIPAYKCIQLEQMERFKWVHMAPPSLHAHMLIEAQGCGTTVHIQSNAVL